MANIENLIEEAMDDIEETMDYCEEKIDYIKHGKNLIARYSISKMESYLEFDDYVAFNNANGVAIALDPSPHAPYFLIYEDGVHVYNLGFEECDDNLLTMT